MVRRAAVLLMLIAALAVLGYTPLGGRFAELAQMLLFVAVGVLSVMLALPRRRRASETRSSDASRLNPTRKTTSRSPSA